MAHAPRDTATITSKGQLVVPARIRRKLGIRQGTQVRFVERNGEIVLQPVTKEFIRSLQGSLTADGPATEDLLRDRAADRRREDARS